MSDHPDGGLTLVVVENLVFGSRGSFRSEMTPDRVAEWALILLRFVFCPDGTGFTGPVDYCDEGSAAVAIFLSANRVLLRYHAAGDLAEARAWFLKNDHLRSDGCMGPYVETKRRAVS
jgi:hypothetical protein